jgi:hypothetical protein
VAVGRRILLVLLDTQWWLNEGPRPGPGPDCAATTAGDVVEALIDVIGAAAGRHVVVAGHHPLVSSGPHGGRFSWKDHLFPLRALARWAWVPLPVIGSAYPISRRNGISRQDQSSGAYRDLRAALETAFDRAPPLVYAAGHEHGLEVHRGARARYVVVSGGGSWGKVNALRPRSETAFALGAPGFMRIDVHRDGRLRLTVIALDDAGRPFDAWSEWLE